MRPFVALVFCALLPAQQPAAGNRYGFPDWRKDFPFTLDLPVPAPGRLYDRSRRQALESVVSHLQGNTRREVWQMATEFFGRAPKDAVVPLIEAMDRAYPNLALADVVKNTVDAMGLVGDERFDEALRRALEHSSAAVQQAAYAALATSGREETILEGLRWFEAMDGRARANWLRAARLRLGERAVPMFRQLMATQPIQVRDQLLKEALQMSPAAAAEILRPRWEDAVGEFKVVIAAALHAAGDLAATAWLRDAMAGQDPALAAVAVRHVCRNDPGVLREDVLRLSLHGRAEVRLEVVRGIAPLTGDDVADTLEVLARPDETWEVKALALKALTRRGRSTAVTALLEDAVTATGTRLQHILDMLATSGDDRAIPLFVERFHKAPAGEGRPFLQAMAFSGSLAGFDALVQLFLGPELPVTDADRQGGALTTLNYPPVLLQNVRDAAERMVSVWPRILADDVVRRGYWLTLLVNVAAEQPDPEQRRLLYRVVRDVLFDREAQSQLRILALNLLTRKALDLDDAMRMKEGLLAEAVPMRSLWNDFLWEYF